VGAHRASREQDLLAMALDAGFADARIVYDPGAIQPCLVCTAA
jgi:hypothetical protein